jgi:serine/threonine protein phosphatase PrpC
MRLLRSAAETHTGYVRTTNQDLALISNDLIAVADGMGGHLGGEVAARTAIEELLSAWRNDRSADGLVGAVRRANRAIWRRSKVDRKLHGMGTTLTAVALVSGGADADGDRTHVALVNIGDSRAYELDGRDQQLYRLTEDHSVVEEMVRQGELTPAEAAVHPHRHVLTRALGIDAEVAMDLWDLDPVPGTRIMLCSDGLTNEVAESEIAEVLATFPEPAAAARELVGRALGHGGIDNVTVVVVDVVEGSEDEADVPVEMVPALASGSDPPPGDGRDITEAIPVTPADGAGAADAGAADAVAAAGADDAGAVADDAGAVADPTNDSGVTGDGSRATDGADAATAGLGMAAAGTLGNVDPHATAAMATLSGVALGGVGTAANGADPADPAEAETEAVAATAGGEITRTKSGRRVGRSMTVRARPKPPAIDGVIGLDGRSEDSSVNGGPATGRHRPLVLVPHGRPRSSTRDRIVTVRVALFALLVAGVIAGTAGTVVWFNSASYYVGLRGKWVAIYQGRPGGILWFKPQLLEVTGVTTAKLPAPIIGELRSGIVESRLDTAHHLVLYLARVRPAPTTAPTTTFPSTTTTTVVTASTVPVTASTVPTTTKPPVVVATSTTQPATTTTIATTTTTTVPASTVPTTTKAPGGH